MATPTDIVNRALNFQGNRNAPVTGTYPNFDNSPSGVAAQLLYPQVVGEVLREFEFDFTRGTDALVLTGNVAPFPWAFEYTYPAAALEIWQVMPATLADVNNPLPINWSVGNALVASVQVRVIWANLVAARAVFNNNPRVETWDASVTDAIVRRLASAFALALSGAGERAENLLRGSAASVEIAKGRDG